MGDKEQTYLRVKRADLSREELVGLLGVGVVDKVVFDLLGLCGHLVISDSRWDWVTGVEEPRGTAENGKVKQKTRTWNDSVIVHSHDQIPFPLLSPNSRCWREDSRADVTRRLLTLNDLC
jgi:hypothetical protein